MNVYFRGHNQIQDNSITLAFRESTMERFSEQRGDDERRGFDNYTGAAIKDQARKLSKPVLTGLHRWFESVTKTLGDVVDQLA